MMKVQNHLLGHRIMSRFSIDGTTRDVLTVASLAPLHPAKNQSSILDLAGDKLTTLAISPSAHQVPYQSGNHFVAEAGKLIRMSTLTFRPTRRKGAFVRDLGTELLVIDPESKKAHCLNETAGKIWMLCNGDNTVLEVATFLSQEFSRKVDAKVVWMALAQLHKAKLLVSLPSFSEQLFSASRREMLRKTGMSVALVLPLVLSIVIPSPAAAASCRGPGVGCMLDSQCCSGRCNNGGHCKG
jgi:hypothetical protein